MSAGIHSLSDTLREDDSLPSQPPRFSRPVAWALAVGISVLFFAAVAPTLGWMGFYNGTEKISVATALQTRRDGHWLIPMLDGRPRFVKPPLTAWATALTIDRQTVVDMGSRDPAVRQAAFHRFNIEARIWPLISCCILLLSVFELGRVLGGNEFGLICQLVCASSCLLLKFSRLATSDVQLALWVSVANVFLAHAIFNHRRWFGCVGAGVALGLALMSKGPVALVESLVPALAFASYCALIEPRQTKDASKWFWPILVGASLMLLIEIPWYAYVIHRLGNVWRNFSNEITGADSPDRASPWYSYLGFVWLFLPWAFLMFLGAIAAIVKESMALKHSSRDDSGRRLIFALFLFLLPLLILSFFKDKRDRYVLPMAGSAAVLAAAGAVHCAREMRRGNKGAFFWRGLHDSTLVVIATVAPIAGALGVFDLKDNSGKPVFSVGLALGAVAVCWLLLGVGFLTRRSARTTVAPVTAAIMLIVQALFFRGYSQTDDGASPALPAAEAIWNNYPDARILNVGGSSALGPTELSIYLDRTFPPTRLDDATSLRPGSQPVVAVIKLPAGSPVEARAQLFKSFANWRFFDRIVDDTHAWYLFVLPAKSAAGQ